MIRLGLPANPSPAQPNPVPAEVQSETHFRLAEMFKAYRPLYAASLVARYLADFSSRQIDGAGPVQEYRDFLDYMPPEAVVARLVRKRLNQVEQQAVAFFDDETRRSLKRVQAAFA